MSVTGIELQKSYWAPNHNEKAALLKIGVENLSWKALLRLHHLHCVEVFHSGMRIDQSGQLAQSIVQSEPSSSLSEVILDRLTCAQSPYHSRHCMVWQGDPANSEASIIGLVRNASFTHCGSLEIISLNDKYEPMALDFLSFNEIRGIAFGGPALFRAAKIEFEDERPAQLVWIPLIYGLSWSLEQSHLHDGTMTMFTYSTTVKARTQISIGVGHQDLTCEKEGHATLFGVGSIKMLATMLQMSDPDFDCRCRRRGMDPVEIRSKIQLL
jgi:hypothetical protein